MGTTTAETTATKKTARRLAQAGISTATMVNVSPAVIDATTTMTVAMAVMKKGKQINLHLYDQDNNLKDDID